MSTSASGPPLDRALRRTDGRGDFARDAAAEDAAVRDLTWTIWCGNTHRHGAPPMTLAPSLLDPARRRAFANLSRLPELWRCLAGDSSEACRPRTREVHIAGLPTPTAKDVPQLLEVARRQLHSLPQASPERVGVAGLMHLLIHPLTDGNGRSARMTWACALLEHGFDLRECENILQRWLESASPDLMTMVQIAAHGDPSVFFERWLALLRDHQQAGLGPKSAIDRRTDNPL